MKKNKDDLVILQIGTKNWKDTYKISDKLVWEYVNIEEFDTFEWDEYKSFDLVFLDTQLTDAQIEVIQPKTKPYRCYYTIHYMYKDRIYDVENYQESDVQDIFRRSKRIEFLNSREIQQTLEKLDNQFFNIVGGTKLSLETMEISNHFHGRIRYNGHIRCVLTGEFGEDYQDLLVWRNSMSLLQNRAVEFWLEYDADKNVDIELRIDEIAQEDQSKVARTFTYNKEDLKNPIVIERQTGTEYYSASLRAKGKGTLSVGNLHWRESRIGKGAFFVGGQRISDHKNEEFISYFNPGDLKPPLNVYFSGYRTLEGFEGEGMMKGFGAPYLLIGDPRLEGGSFYLGSKEFEKRLLQTIRHTLHWLGFKENEVILSGLSMGTFGALYYGIQMPAHAIIVGKPLISLGNVAQNEKVFRPGVFATSLDLLKKNIGGLDEESVKRFNNKFWNRFDQTDFKGTKIAAAYMLQDDYDSSAYFDLLEHKQDKDLIIYGKGIEGRHNDNTLAVVQWFVGQYKEILANDFGRDMQ